MSFGLGRLVLSKSSELSTPSIERFVPSFEEFGIGSVIDTDEVSDPRENKSCTWGPRVHVRLDFFGRTVSCSGDEQVLSKLSSCSSNLQSIIVSFWSSLVGESDEKIYKSEIE